MDEYEYVVPVPRGELEVDLRAMVATEDVGTETDYQMARHHQPAKQRELRGVSDETV